MLLLMACVASSPGPGRAVDSAAPDVPEDVPDAIERLPDAPVVEAPGEAEIVLGAPSGLYDAPFTLTLGSTAGGDVRYTLDGTDPIGGMVYAAPLSVETTTVVRAAALVDGVVASTRAATYLFPADVPAQSAPAGWPREWWTDEAGGPYAADYEMDPEITGGAAWAAAAPTLFTDLPVLSLVLDPDALFDERTGIHENFDGHGDAWERVVSAELFEPGGGWYVECGVRLHGASGRYPGNTPKKSFRLAFRGEYGPTTLDHMVFPDSPVDRFDTLVLRAGYNRSWAHAVAASRTRADYVRERFGHEVYRRMGHAAPHVRHVHLLLDGVYWGLYQLEERPDADFLAAYLGGDAEEWDALNAGVVVDGDDLAWQELMARIDADLSEPASYAAVEAFLDVDAFADYWLLNVALGNIDWPDRNWWAGRRRVDGERWRFVTWDNEYLLVEPDDVELDRADADTPGEIFQALRANPEFRVRFGDRAHRHLFGDGALTADATVATFEETASVVGPGILGESARWGDHWRDVRGADDAELYTYEGHWAAERARITGDYLVRRGGYVLDALRQAGLYPSVDAPTVEPAGGGVAAGGSVTLSAPAGEVLYTLHGADPRLPGGAIAPEAVRYEGAFPLAESAMLAARAWDGEAWSALVEVELTVE